MKRRGGRSAVGRWSPWPATRRTARDGLIVLAAVGGTTMASGRLWLGLSLFSGALLSWAGVRLYDRRWQRLQSEIFRRRT